MKLRAAKPKKHKKPKPCRHAFVEWRAPSGYVVERSCKKCGLERPR